MKTRTRLLAGSLLALPLLYLFFRGVVWSELAAAFAAARPLPLAGVVLATVAAYFLRAWRWGWLLAPLGRVPFGRLVSATYVGFMTGLLVPRAGEVVRPYLVARRHGMRTSAAFASIVLERLFDLIAVLVLFGLYLFVLPQPEAQTAGPLLDVLETAGVLVGAASLALLGLLVAFHVHAERALALLERLLGWLPRGLAAPLAVLLRSFGEGLAVLKAPAGHLIGIGVQSLLLWLALGLGVHWNNSAFGVELPYHASFLVLGFLTVGVAVPTPGMVGGFHEAFLLALTQSFGVDKGTAAAAGIALHALNTLPVLVVGLLLLGGEGLSLGKVAEMTEDKPAQPDASARLEQADGAEVRP